MYISRLERIATFPISFSQCPYTPHRWQNCLFFLFNIRQNLALFGKEVIQCYSGCYKTKKILQQNFDIHGGLDISQSFKISKRCNNTRYNVSIISYF